jgi:alpha-beta hydrolase superfamily lysophospholipase
MNTITPAAHEQSDALPLSARVRHEATFFGPNDAPLFGWFHFPKQVTQHATGIVICPPIGHEYVHSHRSLRHLADHLASLGFVTLRFDYHGSGDSSGLNQDPQRVDAWLESVRQAIIAIKSQTNCQHIGLVGLRLGATFAGIIAGEQHIDSLVLWEPCIQGRRYVRELKALHLTATAHDGKSIGENEDIESAGFIITNETAQALGRLNLKKVTPLVKDVLICRRDDAVDDTGLDDAWTALGSSVKQIRYTGYADMMAETHFTVVPDAVIQQIGDWLLGNCKQARKVSEQVGVDRMSTQAVAMPYREYIHYEEQAEALRPIQEYILQFGEQQHLFGIVSQPDGNVWQQLPTVILLNSGSVHHIGPHRLYVFLARHFAQMGFRCLRLDLSGLGDSYIDDVVHENHPYTPTASKDTNAAISALKHEQPDAKFVLMGLCSGAYAAFHAGIDIKDEQISECLLINPLTFYWKEGMSLAIPSEVHYRQWNDYMASMRKWDKWLKLFRGGVSVVEIIRTIAERMGILVSVKLKNLKKIFQSKHSSKKGQHDLAADLQTIANTGRKIRFIFSENDPGYDLLLTNAGGAVKRLEKQGRLSIEIVSRADHTFSKNAARQVVMQHLAYQMREDYLQKNGRNQTDEC